MDSISSLPTLRLFVKSYPDSRTVFRAFVALSDQSVCLCRLIYQALSTVTSWRNAPRYHEQRIVKRSSTIHQQTCFWSPYLETKSKDAKKDKSAATQVPISLRKQHEENSGPLFPTSVCSYPSTPLSLTFKSQSKTREKAWFYTWLALPPRDCLMTDA
ncbi:uncharacterized protein BKA78DRAFT_321360 [Phyllosticta capitalensis]|uniref:uncharacterized protein n=1 Tax=Phyllosticta capitalensis TaxID=121624 RepID=UPI00312E4F5D